MTPADQPIGMVPAPLEEQPDYSNDPAFGMPGDDGE